MRDDAKIEQRNLATQQKGFEDIMQFSQSAVKLYTEVKNEQTKREASEIWAEGYNNPDSPEEIKLTADYNKAEKAAEASQADVNKALSTNLQKKQASNNLTAQDSADAAKVRQYTGWRAIVYANGQADAASESWGPAFDNYLRKTNAQRAANGLPPVAPGSEFNQVRTEFNQKWSAQSGMALANPGYTAKNIMPKLRKAGAQASEAYTRTWNRQEAATQTAANLIALQDGTMTMGEFSIAQKGLTTSNGKDLMTNDDVLRTIANANFDVPTIQRLSKDTNPATKRPFGDSPRWQALLTDARRRRNSEYSIREKEQSIESERAFNNVSNHAEAQAVYEGLIESGVDRNTAYSAYSRAMGRTNRKMKVDAYEEKFKTLIETNGWDYKLTPADTSGAPWEVISKFRGHLAQDTEDELLKSQIQESDVFKNIEKDMGGLINSVDPTIKLANTALGIDGPPNQYTFEAAAMNDIANRTQILMLGEDMPMDKAIKIARNNWVEDQRKLAAAGEFYDPAKGFLQDAIEANPSARAKGNAMVRQLARSSVTNLPAVLDADDYLAPQPGQPESPRMKFLGQIHGKTPSDIRALARAQKGLPQLERTPIDMAFDKLDAVDYARIASLGDNTEIQQAIQAQIRAGEKLSGNAKQRTISVGRYLIMMGVNGIWQSKWFDYDKGYDPTGTSENSGHAENSFHNHEEALDIGGRDNSRRQMEMTYEFLEKNKELFGIAELYYDPDGTRGHPAGHAHHIHVSFAGGDDGELTTEMVRL